MAGEGAHRPVAGHVCRPEQEPGWQRSPLLPLRHGGPQLGQPAAGPQQQDGVLGEQRGGGGLGHMAAFPDQGEASKTPGSIHQRRHTSCPALWGVVAGETCSDRLIQLSDTTECSYFAAKFGLIVAASEKCDAGAQTFPVTTMSMICSLD